MSRDQGAAFIYVDSDCIQLVGWDTAAAVLKDAYAATIKDSPPAIVGAPEYDRSRWKVQFTLDGKLSSEEIERVNHAARKLLILAEARERKAVARRDLTTRVLAASGVGLSIFGLILWTVQAFGP